MNDQSGSAGREPEVHEDIDQLPVVDAKCTVIAFSLHEMMQKKR
jgi:hypothetical protein